MVRVRVMVRVRARVVREVEQAQARQQVLVLWRRYPVVAKVQHSRRASC